MPQTSIQSPAGIDSHRHIQSLDGFRGLAVLLVFIFHAANTTHLTSPIFATAGWLGRGGWMGVDLFFVLSGFLITGILADSIDKPRYFSNFYVRRTLRIFPLFYGVFLLLLLMTPILHLEWKLGHLSYLLYLQNITANVDPGLKDLPPAVTLAHFWSLAVEEQFYLAWPLTLWLIRDRRKLMRLCVVLAVASLFLRIALVSSGFIGRHDAWNWIYDSLPTHWDGLLMGAWLALAIRRWPVEEVIRRTRWPLVIALASFAVVVVESRDLMYLTPWMSTLGFSAVAITFAGLLLRCLVPGSIPGKFFESGALRFLGRYSYGIYVYHRLFSPLLGHLLYWLEARLHSRALGACVFLVVWFGGSVAVAWLSFHLFESRFLRLKDRFAPSQRRAAYIAEMHENLSRPEVEAVNP
jgi:peptidoglycan/LPS O-acetylase OafA/YrhL